MGFESKAMPWFDDALEDDVDAQSKVVDSAKEYYQKFANVLEKQGKSEREIGRIATWMISERDVDPRKKAMLLVGRCALAKTFGDKEKGNLWSGGKKFVEQMERYNTEKRADGSWKYIGWGGTVDDESGVMDIELQRNHNKIQKKQE